MATGRLTWQNVEAPDFSGAVEAQRASAQAFDNAMVRLGGAVQTFDNNRKDRAGAAVLRNAMQYQNADELQAAIASGALMDGVNPDHVRVEALLKAQAQAGQLMALDKDRQQLATSKQAYEHNEKRNPQLLTEGQLRNEELEQSIAHRKNMNPLEVSQTQANLRTTQLGNVVAEDNFNTLLSDREADKRSAAEIHQLNTTGVFLDPHAWQQYSANLNPADPVHKRILAYGQTKFPDVQISAPGSYGGPALSVPQPFNPPGWVAQGATQGNVLGQALYGQESNFGQTKTDHVNEHGVTGPMQVQDVTWREMQRLNIIPKDWDHRDPKQNLEAGFRWADHLTKKHGGDLSLAAAEYYGGPKAVNSDGTINRHYRDLKNPKAPTVGQYVDQIMQRVASNQAPSSMPQTAARPTAATMGVPAQTQTQAQPSPVAAPPVVVGQPAPTTAPAVGSTPPPATPAATQPVATTPAQSASPSQSGEAAAILARATNRFAGLTGSMQDTAVFSGFAEAQADQKMDLAGARKWVMERTPGLDAKDVDAKLKQVRQNPFIKTPAAAAWVVANGGTTNRAFDPFNWTNFTKIDSDGVDNLIHQLTTNGGENTKAAIIADEVNKVVAANTAEAEKDLTAVRDQLKTSQESLKQFAPGTAAHTAMSRQIQLLKEKEQAQIAKVDSSSAATESLYQDAYKAADPVGWAKQQEAKKQKAESNASKSSSANAESAPEQPTPPTKLKWRRGMTAAEQQALRDQEAAEKSTKAFEAERAKQAKEAAAKAKEAELKTKAAKFTKDEISKLSSDELTAMLTMDFYKHLTREQHNAMIARRLRLKAGGQ